MNRQEKLAIIKEMIRLIAKGSHDMPNCIFTYYVNNKIPSEQKLFYNLIADSFLTLYSFSNLMKENCWSQAFAVLRMGIEQVSAVYLLTTIPESLQEYINLYALKVKYINLVPKEAQKEFLKEYNIPRNKVNDFFDYSWVSKFTSDGTFGRNQMIQLARLEEFLVDINQSLNAFSHGTISVFQMNGENWNVMKRYVVRACLICCKLFDFLCCSYHKLIGDEEFKKLPLDDSFKMFKNIYHDFFIGEEWIRDN